MGRKIEDEFTDLSVTRHRKWELRNEKKGLCYCGQPKQEGSDSHCKKCLLKRRYAARDRGDHQPKTPESRGRKQIIPDEELV